jgi:hypothetical protein
MVSSWEWEMAGTRSWAQMVPSCKWLDMKMKCQKLAQKNNAMPLAGNLERCNANIWQELELM